ncbi:MAG TPA: DUF1972 domain-containing protein [Nitrospiraceae bacterium]|nr:DUF1972 domain-containing protein [Nitrospiraceae bacterium]
MRGHSVHVTGNIGAQQRTALVYDLSIVGTVGLPASYGGFETLAEHLVLHFAQRYHVQVFCTSKRRQDRPLQYLGADLSYVSLDANGWQSICYDIVSLWRAGRRTRTLLVLGVSGCIFLPIIRLIAPRVRIVTHIDGLEWKRRKWGHIARAVLHLSERIAVRYSHAVIADNQAIREYVDHAYGIGSYLIAYGGDNGSEGDLASRVSLDTSFTPGTYFLTVCRIEPENNIAEILEAFQQTPGQRLVIVGNWSASNFSRQLRQRYRTLPNIELLDPIYDRARLAVLRHGARAYVHGHSAGGTNPSLVEAMSAGMAVLAFDVKYNRYTTNDEAIYWKSSAELARIVSTVSEEELKKNGGKMFEYAKHAYTWAKVVAQYEAVLFPKTEI